MKPIMLRLCGYVPWKYFFSSLVFLVSVHSIAQNNFSSGTISESSVAYLRLNEVNSHAARHFRDHFSDIENEKWTRVNQYYVASFVDGNTADRVYYNSKGSFAYCTKYYEADAMDQDLKNAILKKYKGCDIKVVTEISNLEKQIYFVKIKDGSEFKTLRCAEGNIDVIENFVDGGM